MALTELEKAQGSDRKVYSLGALIHNPQEMAALEAKGLVVLDEKALPPVLSASTVIIRAHGAAPALEAELKARGAVIADATCPKVKANQLKAQKFSQAGRKVFIAGEKNHAEMLGLKGYAPGAVVLPSSKALAASQVPPGLQTCVCLRPVLMAQTTFSASEFKAIACKLQQLYPGLEVADTICPATSERQQALRDLCLKVEAVIVAGGKSSANTRRLLAIAQNTGIPAWGVESAGDIPPQVYAYQRLGLSAGASTPAWVIDSIEKVLLMR
jgi:4-hydroxy-3-methylbut-2-enyl diphosphate reductase